MIYSGKFAFFFKCHLPWFEISYMIWNLIHDMKSHIIPNTIRSFLHRDSSLQGGPKSWRPSQGLSLFLPKSDLSSIFDVFFKYYSWVFVMILKSQKSFRSMRNPVRPPVGFFNRRLSTRQNSSSDKVSDTFINLGGDKVSDERSISLSLFLLLLYLLLLVSFCI